MTEAKTASLHLVPAIDSRFLELDTLIPYARNARTHSPEQVAQIAASIEEFGFTNPVLADDRGIVAGHGRVMAARLLYERKRTLRLPNGTELPAGTVPVIDVSGWSEAQRKAYILADNELAAQAGWDLDLLRLELEEIEGLDFDLSLIGFSQERLDEIMAPPATEGATDADDLPGLPVEPISLPGDVWLLGRHRIVCGDSTDAATVERVLAGAKPHLMVTDPPYGVEYDANWRNEAARNSEGMGNRALGAGAIGKVMNDDRADWREAWALFPGDVAYVWHAGLFAGVVAESLQACGFALRSQVIWAKQQFAIGRGDYHWQHEPCWYAVREGKTGAYNGDRTQSTLWQIDKPQKSETGHSTQKPVECMKRPIENNSKPGDEIYEPFSGSGTTIIACEMTRRTALAIELSPAYVDLAVRRWEDFAKGEATLEGDGRTFADVAEARRSAT